ncbi:diaminopimelate epimerase [Lujinxingia litoralis]|uniref:Diaminopimelate epimerase n=1 Tax=Lujinxingia litoralis TaxID=2211119 RepID=A0A328C9C7_9DELT|nr:diaminopimelate epimerase [Lujinxingia litoralis]RAL23594.1 diaminopimelate epimerase [Lujinxingia litoralis]
MWAFAKYHGLGNDFVIVERAADSIDLAWVRAICDRHRGVGADGVLALARLGDDRVRMVVFNRDGSRPQMCGNGVRCAAGYARRHWGMGERLVVESDAGPRHCEVGLGEGPAAWQVRVDMGAAIVEEAPELALSHQGTRWPYVQVDMGNPHAVIFEHPNLEVIDRLGAAANADHPQFEEGTNVEFVERQDDGWRVTVYERGVGRTQACGTGACAVAAAIWAKGWGDADAPLVVELPGGTLELERRDGQIWMQGPAVEVFSGIYTG